ncbi:MAG: hypothetical protein M1831_004614 [Alyxoria varia]|nr:MAG: hypothetical protein M1831_004614 [Alyxoria varia]
MKRWALHLIGSLGFIVARERVLVQASAINSAGEMATNTSTTIVLSKRTPANDNDNGDVDVNVDDISFDEEQRQEIDLMWRLLPGEQPTGHIGLANQERHNGSPKPVAHSEANVLNGIYFNEDERQEIDIMRHLLSDEQSTSHNKPPDQEQRSESPGSVTREGGSLFDEISGDRSGMIAAETAAMQSGLRRPLTPLAGLKRRRIAASSEDDDGSDVAHGGTAGHEEAAQERFSGRQHDRPSNEDRYKSHVRNGLWIDQSMPLLSPIRNYPPEEEVDSIINKLHQEFFGQFQNKGVPVPSGSVELRFGPPHAPWTCRLVWQNPRIISYPRVGVDHLEPNTPINPEDYPVHHSKSPHWAKGVFDYKGVPAGSPPPELPTLSQYLKMRLMARMKNDRNKRWPSGQGGLLMSLDGRFALGYRVWISATDMPPDPYWSLMEKLGKRGGGILQDLVEELYKEGKEPDRSLPQHEQQVSNEPKDEGHYSRHAKRGVWMDRSVLITKGLRRYPRQSEVDELLNYLQKEFFHGFQLQRLPQEDVLIPSTSMIFKVGSTLSCRFVWLNQQGVSYPQGRVRIDTPINPEVYPVVHHSRSVWTRGILRYNGKPIESVPFHDGDQEIPPGLPNLAEYLRMRLMSTVLEGKTEDSGEKRWNGGVGGMLVSRDGYFALGYRVWEPAASGRYPPLDRNRHDTVKWGDVYKQLIEELYMERQRKQDPGPDSGRSR